MAATKIVAGALFLALAATTWENARESSDDAARPASALVVRASAPIALGDLHGDASFHLPFGGRGWRVALAWSSEGGHTRAGVVIAERVD
jgi:hypothetical protein